jgi:membrane-bound serine protease (ClpP class)
MGDVAPINFSGEMVGEKFQAPIRKTMETYARARGYPVPLVHSMVTTDIEVLRIRDDADSEWRYVTRTDWDAMPDADKAGVEKEVVVPEGQLLTMTAQDAREYGFVPKENGTVTSRLELYDVLEIDSDNVQRLYLSATERILTYLDVVTPMLLSVGLIFLFIEFSNPGFGLPGIAGVVCLALFFTVKFSLGYARMFEIILFMVGIGLILAEILVIPGFGIAGVSGILLVVASLVLVFQQFTLPNSPTETVAFQANLLKVLGSLTLAAVGIAVAARFLPSLPFFSKIVHSEDLGTARVELEDQPDQRPSRDMIGDSGVALTALRPAGRADFDGRLMDVVTEGEFLEKGAKVEIIAIHGNRVVVTAQGRA